MAIKAQAFIHRVLLTLKAHLVEDADGVYYERFLHADKQAGRTDVYGTADAANLLYTVNGMPELEADKAAWVKELQSFQEQGSGMFRRLYHNELHSAAFAISALELFDGKPLYPLQQFAAYRSKEGLYELLEQLDWVQQPWGESQKGSGVFASLVLAQEVDSAWETWYFDWLKEQADPATGLWRKGCIVDGAGELRGAPLFHHLAGSFHYLFNMAYRNQPIPYVEALVDTCIALFRSKQWEQPKEQLSFFEIDWIYVLGCCLKQADYRRDEVLAVFRESAAPFLAYIEKLGEQSPAEPFEDLHSLCGAVSGLAVIQQLTPELVLTDRPLQLVLDRRPFI